MFKTKASIWQFKYSKKCKQTIALPLYSREKKAGCWTAPQAGKHQASQSQRSRTVRIAADEGWGHCCGPQTHPTGASQWVGVASSMPSCTSIHRASLPSTGPTAMAVGAPGKALSSGVAPFRLSVT